MHVVVVTEKDGKIELTKDELQKLLDDAYTQGKSDVLTISYPYTPIVDPNPNTTPITNPPNWYIHCSADDTLRRCNEK